MDTLGRISVNSNRILISWMLENGNLRALINQTVPHGFRPLLAECKGSNKKELWKRARKKRLTLQWGRAYNLGNS
jgi:hypothetical protein